MSDIKNLFDDVARSAGAPPSPETIEADLARGRGALVRAHRQRTIRRSAIAGGSLVVAVAVVAAATQLGGGSNAHHHPANASHHVTTTKTAPTKKTPKKHTRIKLVAYHGKQLNGFTVDTIPDGWHLSTSTQYALLIDPAGDKDNDPNAFEGKLAVLTSSIDQNGLGKGDHVTVNGQPGVVSDQGKYGIMLNYNDPNGFGVNIQAPAELNWTDQQIVNFAEGVHVTGNAIHSRG